MNDFKEALIETIRTSDASSGTELMQKLLIVYYALAFSDGQRYINERNMEPVESGEIRKVKTLT